MKKKLPEINFMGARVNPITMEETLRLIDEMIKSGKPHQHIVVNTAKIVNMQKNKELANDVNTSDIINADGMGVVWGARLLGEKIPERVAGIDLFAKLLELSEKKGYRVYFFGAKDDVLKAMIVNLKEKYPKLKIAGYRNGYYYDEEQNIIANNIRKSKAQLLFLGITSPKKERFIHSQLKNTGVSFAMGVGGSFDVFAGKTKRAPLWMQKIGLEWFYRLIQEPKRMFGRYFKTNSVFLWMLVKEKVKRSISRKKREEKIKKN
jgi:N-acetylglucosaminyldiphosphoundecaprenol N-acetyl-beta-D-mannosaminyltransferase